MQRSIQRALEEGAARLGVPLGAADLERFDRYLTLLLRWNGHIKLTSVTDAADVVEKHFLDSLAVVPALADAGEAVDVGSGAGFPGLVVAMVRGSMRVVVVESIQKKAAFLEALKRELGLANVVVVADRMESLVASGRRFEAAVSRATFAPGEWIRRGASLVAPGGRLVAMVVPEPGSTVDRVAPGWEADFARGRLEAPYAPGRSLVVLEQRRAVSDVG